MDESIWRAADRRIQYLLQVLMLPAAANLGVMSPLNSGFRAQPGNWPTEDKVEFHSSRSACSPQKDERTSEHIIRLFDQQPQFLTLSAERY